MRKLTLAGAQKLVWSRKSRTDLGLQGRNGQGQPDRPSPSPYGIGKATRWSSPSVPGVAVLRNTRGEARAWFKGYLGATLPPGFQLVAEEV